MTYNDSHVPVSAIIAYERGELDGDGLAALFQRLVDSDLIDHLQGHYQRTAHNLIVQGVILPKKIKLSEPEAWAQARLLIGRRVGEILGRHLFRDRLFDAERKEIRAQVYRFLAGSAGIKITAGVKSLVAELIQQAEDIPNA